jgi:hypothetical protein
LREVGGWGICQLLSPSVTYCHLLSPLGNYFLFFAPRRRSYEPAGGMGGTPVIAVCRLLSALGEFLFWQDRAGVMGKPKIRSSRRSLLIMIDSGGKSCITSSSFIL